MIQLTIENHCITVKFYDVNIEVKTELRQKVILQLSFRELHIDMLKIDSTSLSMAYDEKLLVRISDSAIQLILPPQLQKMIQHHQTFCGCKICI